MVRTVTPNIRSGFRMNDDVPQFDLDIRVHEPTEPTAKLEIFTFTTSAIIAGGPLLGDSANR
jgi:hypothetical protein